MLYKLIRRQKEMDEQQERDYYQQQKNIPIVTPNLFGTYNPIWTSTLANSRSKSAKWFARLLLVFYLAPFIGGTALGTLGLINLFSRDSNKYSTSK